VTADVVAIARIFSRFCRAIPAMIVVTRLIEAALTHAPTSSST
jgi:hypothetical protein